MAETTLTTRVNKLEIISTEHGKDIKELQRDMNRIDVSAEGFKQFMIEQRTESRAREKSLNKIATIIGIISALSPVLTVYLSNILK